jgi:hypothetical protein
VNTKPPAKARTVTGPDALLQRSREVTLDGTSFSASSSELAAAGVCACAIDPHASANAVARTMDRIMR